MAEIGILASGSGTNFQAIAERVLSAGRHHVSCLIVDRRRAYARDRARQLGIPDFYVPYRDRPREVAEGEIQRILRERAVDLVVLAGFMRLLTPGFVDAFPGRIINIHPSLLPKYPGAHAIEESFRSSDERLGITIHYVDHGMDSGPIIVQESLARVHGETLAQVEQRIHDLEHQTYPAVVEDLLDAIDRLEESKSGIGRRSN